MARSGSAVGGLKHYAWVTRWLSSWAWKASASSLSTTRRRVVSPIHQFPCGPQVTPLVALLEERQVWS